jgi:RNA polymerase sigma-70 factor (ECF subfamily)
MDNTDKSLVEAHCRGDQRAFAELVRRYGANVLGYLIKVSGSRDEAEDLFQETFKRVHEKAHTLRGNNFRPWLFKVATNTAMDGLRRRGRTKMVSLNERLDGQGGEEVELTCAVGEDGCEPAQEAVRSEQKEKVRRAVELLPKRQRATLVLAYYQQLTYREVAEVLGCSLGTVKIQMYRALRTLARRLPEIGGDLQ